MTDPSARYASIHRITNLDNATENDLRLLIRSYPVIDNHAHNLLREEHALGSSEYPFESITSEAQGHALLDHGPSTLPHIRGIKQLAELYRCPETLQDVKASRYDWVHRNYSGLIEKCLEGTHAIMMDDGLQPEIIHPGKWHRKFVPKVCRIVRIEAIAAELLEHLAVSAGFLKPGLDGDWGKDQSEAFLSRFNTMFRNQIRTLAQDPNVRGFKSVICYRSGLDVGLDSRHVFRPHYPLTETSLLTVFHEFIKQAVRNNQYRIAEKEINDFLVVAVCDVLDKLIDTDGENLPFQFHTGLGDNDINLVKANPAYMQPLIEAFPNVDFVLLHSAYPYTREAGYLAANYMNAWLDIGEVFPMLSRDGEETVLRHALELTPTSKILWSTDGHFYPETYYLANKQFRTVLEKIMVEYVQSGDITIQQAIDMSVDIMFWNSNALYKLDEAHLYPQLLQACGRSSGSSVRTFGNGSGRRDSNMSRATTAATPTNQSASQANNRTTHRSLGGTGTAAVNDVGSDSPSRELADFLQSNSAVKYIWMQMVDYTGTTRQRMIPIAQVLKHINSGSYPGITCALTRLLQNETPAEGCSATGEWKIMFDLSSLCLNKVIESPSATVQTWWMNDTGTPPTEACYACPRSALKKQLEILERRYDINMLMGFEIEIVFMRPIMNANKSDYASFEPLHFVHSWSNMTLQQLDALPIVEEIVATLAEIDIHVPQFHAEAAPGQWEFPLPAFEPIKSIDVLYKARDVIRMVARKHGLKATLYPRPYTFTCGSASHTHLSINGPGNTVERYSDPFLAGILEHLPSILAFTLPLEESYQRIQAGIWAGGEWITWGTQNRETPLRKCGPGHWELKTVDGVGNMYLSMAAVVAAGLSGLEHDKELTLKDCLVDASTLTEEGRAQLGISKQLPNTLRKSLDALRDDDALIGMLGRRLIDDYIAVKEAEMKMLNAMEVDERRRWLMSRY